MDALRTALQPITHNLPTPIRDLGISILGDNCYKTLLLDLDPTATECLKLAISKGLGIGIISASAVVKVPQILKLLNSKSAEGISLTSILLETTAYLISLAYNAKSGFPFSTYGETVFILLQNIVIAICVLTYTKNTNFFAPFMMALTVGSLGLFNRASLSTLTLLQAGAGALGVASKIPQIVSIYQEGTTGQLSAFAVFNYLAGSLSRIFTTIQEVDDKTILYGFVSGFILNAILAVQMVYYWNTPSKKAKGKQREARVAAVPTSGTTTATPKGKSPTTRRRG